MSKIALIGDTHFRGLINEDLYERKFQLFKDVCKYCKDNNVNEVYHLGDVFDRINPLSFELKMLSEVFIAYDVNIKLLIGNHDLGRDKKEHSLGWLEVLQDYMFCIEMYTNFIDLGKIVLIPFADSISIEDYLLQIKNKEDKYVIGHFGVTGVRTYNDVELHEDLVNIDCLQDFRKVFLGHVHYRQLLANVQFIGSLYPINFGETDSKGFTILDIDTGEEEFIILDRFRYKQYKFNLKNMIDIDSIEVEEGDLVKIQLEGYEKEIKLLSISDIRQSLISKGAIDVKFQIQVVKNREIHNSNMVIGKSNASLLSHYLDNINELGNKDLLYNEGIQIMKECR